MYNGTELKTTLQSDHYTVLKNIKKFCVCLSYDSYDKKPSLLNFIMQDVLCEVEIEFLNVIHIHFCL